MKTCTICKLQKDIIFFNKCQNKCKDCKKPIDRQYRRSLPVRFKDAQRIAGMRDKEWKLTFEEFCKILQMPCEYCNNELWPPSFTGCGIDRIDNLLGYTKDNSRSCCPACNRIKGEYLTHYEMKEAMKAVIACRKLTT